MGEFSKLLNGIYVRDNVEFMRTLPDNCIDLTVTSPPYDDLRKYNGYNFDFESVADELFRITKDGGVVVWIVGDKTKNGSESLTSFRQALHFNEIGFNVLDTMIYEKAGGGARGSSYCYSQQTEYMFVLTKGRNKTFNPLMRENVTKRNVDTTASRNADGTISTRKITYKKESKLTNVWRFTNAYGHSTKDLYAHEHPAIFPEKLAEQHILSWSNPGDVVFDCFAGSGTTLKMAMINDRKYIGVELSGEYAAIANQRINDAYKAKEDDQFDE